MRPDGYQIQQNLVSNGLLIIIIISEVLLVIGKTDIELPLTICLETDIRNFSFFSDPGTMPVRLQTFV